LDVLNWNWAKNGIEPYVWIPSEAIEDLYWPWMGEMGLAACKYTM